MPRDLGESPYLVDISAANEVTHVSFAKFSETKRECKAIIALALTSVKTHVWINISRLQTKVTMRIA